MKNLYFLTTIAATLTLSACGNRSNNPAGAPKAPAAKPAATPAVIDQRITDAINAYKSEGYDPEWPENKALAETIGGAEVILVDGQKNENSPSTDPKPKLAEVSIALTGSCEIISKQMYGGADEINKSMPTRIATPNSAEAEVPAEIANMQLKCIGGDAKTCDLISVLLSKEDAATKKPSRVAIAFALNKDGNYEIIGWPNAKTESLKSVTDFVKNSPCWQKPTSTSASRDNDRIGTKFLTK